MVVAAGLLVVLIKVEDHVSQPLLELDLVRRNRVFATANAAGLLASVAFFAITTITAVFLQIVQGHSPGDAGLILLMQPMMMVVLSSLSGRLADRVGARPLAASGALVLAAGMVQLAFASISTGRVLAALATVGVGLAFFTPPNLSAVLGSTPCSQLSLASGFLSTMRFSGQGVSIAVLGSLAAWPLGSEGARAIFLGEEVGIAGADLFADGYRLSMLVGAIFAIAAAVFSVLARSPRVAVLTSRSE